ncbi:MAG TPA: P-loop NTPase [Candidatus Bilamarchaeum sp.]|nr:P-loop NTPase [Candidatus Bilamarchaeum sp.]
MDNPFEEQKPKLKGYKLGVHSGKGGVGKTFLSVNIAYCLAAEGRRVGLLDADIDCPNVAKFLSVAGIATKSGNRLYPVEHKGVKILSSALLSPPSESPIIIRGPIKHNMLLSFLSAAEWGELEYLIIDLPPGTADVPLSAMQLSALDGLILVSAPTKESILDTARAANMAKKLGVKILGLVENMSGEIFGSHGDEIAKKLGVPLLASIPLSKETAQLNENSEIAFLKNPGLGPARTKILETIPR